MKENSWKKAHPRPHLRKGICSIRSSLFCFGLSYPTAGILQGPRSLTIFRYQVHFFSPSIASQAVRSSCSGVMDTYPALIAP
jgi:hypothetical protein